MSREDWEIFAILEKERQDAGHRRRCRASNNFKEASARANDNDLLLIRHSSVHYKIKGEHKSKPFTIELYPGNQRIYHPTKNSPYIVLNKDKWTLMDVVNAVIKALEK